jgi:hypothetical protein
MNLGDIELAVLDRLNFNTSPDSSIRRQVRSDINIGHREILGSKGFGVLRRAVLPATSVASSPYMVLPQAATAIITIIDRANNRILRPMSLQDVRYRDPGQTFTGSIPDGYAVLNYAAPVALDPSAAASLFAVSDSALDGSGTSVNVEGIVTGGVYRRASVVMNGVTAVNISSTISTWIHVLKFYVSSQAAGNISLHETSGVGTELGRIQTGRSYPRYTQVYLTGIPAAAQTYYCDVELHVEDMVNSTDEPLIPEDFHYLLISSALKRYYLKRRDFDSLRAETATWAQGFGNLATFVRRRAGVAVSGQRNNQGYTPGQFNSPWYNG